MRRTRWSAVAALATALLAGSGCFHAQTYPMGPMPGDGPAPIAVPPPGTVPVELDKITLPLYVIEAPDSLLIEVIQKGKFPALDEKGDERVDANMKPILREGTQRLPVQPISSQGGPFLVRLDGTVSLGFWGSVTVSGLNLDQAAVAIRQHIQSRLKEQGLNVDPASLIVIVDVLAYNSKRYYVITDGGGYGEQVYTFPIYGSETVLDALSNINGLPVVASRRNIWVARRTPHPGQPWQILPVDWVGITQHGITVTNYQVMPGDRIYVKAQRIITIDTTLARILSPIERLFGVTLLGTSTVNQINGQGINGIGTGTVR